MSYRLFQVLSNLCKDINKDLSGGKFGIYALPLYLLLCSACYILYTNVKSLTNYEENTSRTIDLPNKWRRNGSGTNTFSKIRNHIIHIMLLTHKRSPCADGEGFMKIIYPPHYWENLITEPIVICKLNFSLLPFCLIDIM